MKKTVQLITVFSMLWLLAAMDVNAGEKAPQSVVALAHSQLSQIGTDPIIVKAVKENNSDGETLAQVKAMDEKWKATPGIAPFMQDLMNSRCGRHLISIQEQKPYIVEIFVMDQLGANVAMTDKTSDYWQGDEAKFINSFNGGGAVFVDDVAFDDSSQAYLVQVSVPVKDGRAVIGAITFGIDLDKLE